MQQQRLRVKVGLVLLLATAWLCGVAGVATALEPGYAPPDFELPDLQKGVVRLSDFRGRPIVLKIATTWCTGCKIQVKELATARQALEKNQVAVVEVYVDESPADIRTDLEAHPHDYPSVIAIDDGKVARKYSLYGVPRVLLIDREFKVRRDGRLISADDLMQWLPALGGEK